MTELKQKLAEWLWERVELRYGFRDMCGDFIDMQSSPYSKKGGYHDKTLCYLAESRELTETELDKYREEFDNGRIQLVPTKSEYWEAVPDFLNDLNACFRQLVPRAVSRIATIFKTKKPSAYATLFNWWLVELQKDLSNPAPALCLAIEKLIDSKEGNSGGK